MAPQIPGASILFWMHDHRAGELLPIFLKVPPDMPVPLSTVVTKGPPPHSVPPGFELSREFEPELRYGRSTQIHSPVPLPTSSLQSSPDANRWQPGSSCSSTNTSRRGRRRSLNITRLTDGRQVLPARVLEMDAAYYYQQTHLSPLAPTDGAGVPSLPPTGLLPLPEEPAQELM